MPQLWRQTSREKLAPVCNRGGGGLWVQIASLSAVGKRVFLLDVDEDGTSLGSKAQNAISSLDSKNRCFIA